MDAVKPEPTSHHPTTAPRPHFQQPAPLNLHQHCQPLLHHSTAVATTPQSLPFLQQQQQQQHRQPLVDYAASHYSQQQQPPPHLAPTAPPRSYSKPCLSRTTSSAPSPCPSTHAHAHVNAHAHAGRFTTLALAFTPESPAAGPSLSPTPTSTTAASTSPTTSVPLSSSSEPVAGGGSSGSAGGGDGRVAPSPGLATTEIKTEPAPDGSVPEPEEGGSARKKQKRNKPTLSCQECVERKTKCDRGRPHCIACIKRQTECRYAHVANLIEETSRSAASGRRITAPARKKLKAEPEGGEAAGGVGAEAPLPTGATSHTAYTASRGYMSLSTGLLSDVPYSLPSASNVFGIGSGHPFANYWTCGGGLAEVVTTLPQQDRAASLIDRYFESVDPVYPMIHRQTFYADYAEFWSMSPDQKKDADPDFVALLLIMLALGAQFAQPSRSEPSSAAERKQLAEFWASGSNQGLRMFSYLSAASIRSIQTMVLIVYFLINDNHCSDGWAFAGILMRQAYAMGLHRDPNIVTPAASIFEKHQRRKLWQAVLLQDTFLTVLLSLPPSATHTDVSVDDLTDDFGSIAASDPTDMAYVRGSWTLANLVQETICSPRSLDLPICATVRHKSKLVADFRAVYRSFPDVFRSWDPTSLARLVGGDGCGGSGGGGSGGSGGGGRVVRQTLFLTSNYFHNLMLVHASEGPDAAVNVRGTLDAAHDAISAFFVLFDLFDAEARVWWVFNHRAFLEALCIGGILRSVAEREGACPETLAKDPLYARAKGDISRMIEIMEIMGQGDQGCEVARTRVQVLSEFL